MQSRELILVAEAKLHSLLGVDEKLPLEASGVRVRNQLAYIVFDDRAAVAVIDAALRPGTPGRLVELRQHGHGFEDIWYDAPSGQFYGLIEAARDPQGRLRPAVEVYSAEGEFLEAVWCDFAVEEANKGFEGLALVHRLGETLLLGLCEGNKCAGGNAGRKGGGGRMQLFRRTPQLWAHAGTIKLPKALDFADYASLDVQGEALAVLSQEASAIWIGRFAAASWEVEGDGALYHFPRAGAKGDGGDGAEDGEDGAGKVVYCNVEGLSWLGERRLMVVSDRRKADTQKPRCGAKDQSVHIFELPE